MAQGWRQICQTSGAVESIKICDCHVRLQLNNENPREFTKCTGCKITISILWSNYKQLKSEV